MIHRVKRKPLETAVVAKNWCTHITWGSPPNGNMNGGWVMLCDYVNSFVIGIPRNWKVCPVCESPRPGKAVNKGQVKTHDRSSGRRASVPVAHA